MSRGLHGRTKWIRALVLLGFASLMVRMSYIEVVKAPKLMRAAEATWWETDQLKAVRGTIYDRNGQKLAYTSIAYIVQADLSMMDDARKNRTKDDLPYQGDPQMYASMLSPLLQVPESQLYQKLTTPGVVGVDLLRTPIDETLKKRIEDLHLKGIGFTETQVRKYPNQSLAAHVLGFVGPDGHGKYGIEAQYDKELSGADGTDTYIKDLHGNPLPYADEKKVPAQNGHDVYLTIDATIQNYAEQALDDIVQKYQPENTSIIVSDPRTGEVLAMANRPTYDPNHYGNAQQSDLDNNRAVNATFEPGSTFKILPLTAAVTEHKINLDDTFQSGSITVSGRTIHDWVTSGWGRITFRKGVENSSNVGFVIIGQKVGNDLMTQYMHNFGYDQPTGIDLPDEAYPLLFKENPLTPLHLATESFGQGISVTAIQQVSAVSAVANGGSVMKPYVMKKIVNPDTNQLVKQNAPVIRSHVGNPDSMKIIRSVLEDDIKNDATHNGYVPGYHVAGKTGTAQIRDPNSPTGDYYPDRYICSFIGFAPAQDPRLEIYVTVTYPKHADQFGNVVATPAAKQVFEKALPYLGVEADGQGTLSSAPASNNKAKYTDVPNVVGMTHDAAIQAAGKKRLPIQVIGDTGTVSKQWPAAGTMIDASRNMICILGNGKGPDGSAAIPDLTGDSLREAADILNQLGIPFTTAGDGYVVSQSKPGGTKVAPGTSIDLTFKSAYGQSP